MKNCMFNLSNGVHCVYTPVHISERKLCSQPRPPQPFSGRTSRPLAARICQHGLTGSIVIRTKRISRFEMHQHTSRRAANDPIQCLQRTESTEILRRSFEADQWLTLKNVKYQISKALSFFSLAHKEIYLEKEREWIHKLERVQKIKHKIEISSCRCNVGLKFILIRFASFFD